MGLAIERGFFSAVWQPTACRTAAVCLRHDGWSLSPSPAFSTEVHAEHARPLLRIKADENSSTDLQGHAAVFRTDVRGPTLVPAMGEFNATTTRVNSDDGPIACPNSLDRSSLRTGKRGGCAARPAPGHSHPADDKRPRQRGRDCARVAPRDGSGTPLRGPRVCYYCIAVGWDAGAGGWRPVCKPPDPGDGFQRMGSIHAAAER